MKLFYLIILSISILFLSCQSENKTTTSTEIATNFEADSVQIQDLVRNLYEWHNTKSTNIDFTPLETTDSSYSGLDMKRHAERIIELKSTNLFTDDFIKNYDNLAKSIDNGLKTKKIQWLVGDLPSFANDVNPWCLCQDNPDNYWKTMTIKNCVFEGENGVFKWTWGDKFEYKAKAKKVNNSWKIDYLEGFDFDVFYIHD